MSWAGPISGLVRILSFDGVKLMPGATVTDWVCATPAERGHRLAENMLPIAKKQPGMKRTEFLPLRYCTRIKFTRDSGSRSGSFPS